MKICIQKKKIDFPDKLKEFSSLNKFSGSINLFLGKVRNKSKYGLVNFIEIENYKKMSFTQITSIALKAVKKWTLDDILIIHRYGKIAAGEDIVLILVASKHRQAGLEAIKFVIDWLKVKATFWKKEITTNGEFWVEQSSDDLEILRH